MRKVIACGCLLSACSFVFPGPKSNSPDSGVDAGALVDGGAEPDAGLPLFASLPFRENFELDTLSALWKPDYSTGDQCRADDVLGLLRCQTDENPSSRAEWFLPFDWNQGTLQFTFAVRLPTTPNRFLSFVRFWDDDQAIMERTPVLAVVLDADRKLYLYRDISGFEAAEASELTTEIPSLEWQSVVLRVDAKEGEVTLTLGDNLLSLPISSLSLEEISSVSIGVSGVLLDIERQTVDFDWIDISETP